MWELCSRTFEGIQGSKTVIFYYDDKATDKRIVAKIGPQEVTIIGLSQAKLGELEEMRAFLEGAAITECDSGIKVAGHDCAASSTTTTVEVLSTSAHKFLEKPKTEQITEGPTVQAISVKGTEACLRSSKAKLSVQEQQPSSDGNSAPSSFPDFFKIDSLYALQEVKGKNPAKILLEGNFEDGGEWIRAKVKCCVRDEIH